MGYLGEVTTKHIDFGLVLIDGKKMSTRKGTAVDFEAVIDEAVEKAKQIMVVKNPELGGEELDTAAEIIGLGAVVYNDLRQSRRKDVHFDWDRMLSFEGESAAYLQYTVVRIRSIVKKVQERFSDARDAAAVGFEDQSEFALVRKLAWWPLVVSRAQATDSPHLVATYLEELAQLFNSFYGQVSIMETEDAILRNSRLRLIQAVAETIANGLRLLNIRVPVRM